MNVHFYIDNEEETPIMDMYDVLVEPFKVGDHIKLSVDELVPKDLDDYKNNMDLYYKTLNDNKELRERFNLQTIEITRMGRYARFNHLSEAKITIEYHCILVLDK